MAAGRKSKARVNINLHSMLSMNIIFGTFGPYVNQSFI